MVCLPGLQYGMCTLSRYRSVLSPSSVCAPLCREPISSLDVPTSTNKAYELVKQAGEGGNRGIGGGGMARGRGGEDVPTTTNEAYELTKQAEKTAERGGGGGGGAGGGSERGGGGEEGFVYEEVSAQSPAQPVAADEVPSLPPLLSQMTQVPSAGEGVYELGIP